MLKDSLTIYHRYKMGRSRPKNQLSLKREEKKKKA